MTKDTKTYLDSLTDDELYFELSLRFGQLLPVWEECSKEEYEEHYGVDGDCSWDNITKWLCSENTYKREPHWKNEQCGILWHIKNCDREPDYYTYYKMVGQEFTLMLGGEMIDYLNNRKPKWL